MTSILQNDSSVSFLKLCGSPYRVGCDYGFRDSNNIRRVLSHYVDISGWFGSSLVDVDSLEICNEKFWSLEGLSEIRGIADGSGVPIENLIYHNLQKYAIGACTHFAGDFNDSGRFYHGANIDIPVFLILRDSLSFHFQRRLVNDKIPYWIPCITGTLFGIAGFNICGLFVSSSMLTDVKQPKKVTGTFHGKIICDLLSSCSNLDEAERFLSRINGWGGWSIAVSIPKDKKVIYAEYHGDNVIIETKNNNFICSNHSQLFQTDKTIIPEHSRLRYERLKGLLLCNDNSARPELSLFDKFNLVKNAESKFRTMNTVFRNDHIVSILADCDGNYFFANSKNAEQKKWNIIRNI
ncbi:MAG: C45 family autoproteolytic acyltransferase/hydrolase [Planctomycetaceae bacterium]|jgi:hypothetical protein|nr:C45 family autoproteolytic acyltransferase/hydrolase [Planctomycetaceae bacterium]